MSAPAGHALSGRFRALLRQDHPAWDARALPPDAWLRLERLADASPLYARLLLQYPDYALWLEQPQNRDYSFRYQALVDEWRNSTAGVPPDDLARDETFLGLLRRWRRKMALRIAYRDVTGLASTPVTVGELTRLGEFCLRECAGLAARQWTRRYGEPWDEEAGKPARFCVLGLGKLGGEELNFSSDIDLIYLYEGEGHCRKDGQSGVFTNVEFFTKVAETTTGLLQAQTADGFLFRVDLRLRPEGAYGPLVRSLASLEHYYAAAGQTWERMALIKARPVAGDLAARRGTAREPAVVSLSAPSAALAAGRGGRDEDPHRAGNRRRPDAGARREVGPWRHPRDRVHRPGVPTAARRALPFPADACDHRGAGSAGALRADAAGGGGVSRARPTGFCAGSSMRSRCGRNTRRTPCRPTPPRWPRSRAPWVSLRPRTFQHQLKAVRTRVRRIYEGLFRGEAGDRAFQEWWKFFTSARMPPAVEERLRRWLGPAAGAADELRLFVCGDRGHQVNRELVVRFQHLADTLDEILPKLAQPVPTLRRIARFAERYGTRQQFFNGCAANPQFFRVLALLFDRSTFIFELLAAHPEIVEEVLRPEVLRKRKGAAALAGDLAAGPPDKGHADWLWLYVKAEQVRYAVGELLGYFGASRRWRPASRCWPMRCSTGCCDSSTRSENFCWSRWENTAEPN